MKRVSTIFILLSILFTSCVHEQRNNGVELIFRDTTISVQNSYSDIFLDSLKVENFIAEYIESDSLKSLIRNFYVSRNYECAWISQGKLTIQAEGFWNAHDNYLKVSGERDTADMLLRNVMDSVLYNDSISIDKNRLVQTELLLTKHFFRYLKLAYGSKTDPEMFQWHIPRRRLSISEMVDTIFSNSKTEWSIINKPLNRLQNAILKFRDIEKTGGWGVIPIKQRAFHKNESDTIIRKIKNRLTLQGYYSQPDTSMFFTDSLQAAVELAQECYGLKQTGVIDSNLIKQLNIPVSERIEQMLINLERIKWMPVLPENYILVNIPQYRLHVFEHKRLVLSMNVVVGKAANNTVIFSDELKYIVFSPYWNIPASITRREIVPAMQRNRNYLNRNNMEITGYSGNMPIIRQRPGGKNALGKVKFLFPNSFNIYFHDTPAKSLFSRDKRAFSHGCIRLERPFELASYLLNSDSSWNERTIRMAMNSNKEKWVTLKKPLPVFITYFTSWIDQEGYVHFIDDIYGHDKELSKQLFNN